MELAQKTRVGGEVYVPYGKNKRSTIVMHLLFFLLVQEIISNNLTEHYEKLENLQ